ncbi:uncharacterized protein [Rutidosis leptorrhynchoides]|uniref:uncharacterized protein n=1 Tax=Rutidosis leptorrhynchoides TaxID=125765 RepID=UPI003A9A60F4
MNPHHKPNQNPGTASAATQVNPAVNQQMPSGNNVGALVYPNINMPFVAPQPFMNFPNQPFPLQNSQFPNGIVGFNPQQNFGNFPINQFNPALQQQGQFFARGPMVPPAYNQNVGLPPEQVLLQNTIQNIYQLLQLQNSNNGQQCPPGNFPMIQNQIPNVMSQQNLGFNPNQQFAVPNCNGPVQHVNQVQQNMGPQLQGNQFMPGASGSAQAQLPQNVLAALTNLQNQLVQGVGPPNQMFGMSNSNGPVQQINQGQPRFVSPMIDGNAPKPVVNFGQTHNPPNFQHNHGNRPITGSGSPNGFKSNKHVKEKFGSYNGNINKEGNSAAAIRDSSKFKKKVPSLNYTEHEVKQWRELRKKNYPSTNNISEKCKKESDSIDQEATLRRQQLKEILAKQAELGCEVADIPPSYLFDSDKQNQNPRDKKHNREQFKKGKFQNKRGSRFHENQNAKRTRPGDLDSFKANHQNRAPKPTEREPSLLKKLLSRDIKRDKNHLLQVFRFMAVNSLFDGDGDSDLRFPSVIVKETNSDVVEETTCAVNGSEMAKEDETKYDVAEKTTCSVSKVGQKDDEDEEGEITD